jgi:C_GCAxxG_C_C family probable redox protein
MLEIRLAGPEDLRAIQNLLSICLLPTSDLRDGHTALFVAETERGIIGAGGLDDVGESVGMLRALAVMPGYRKQQIGRRLVQRLLAQAEELGLKKLFLLTQTACDYFIHIGFEPIERRLAPASVSESLLFRELNPADARLMMCQLGIAEPRSAHLSALSAGAPTAPGQALAAERARSHFDSGYFCAESVLLAVTEQAGIRSPLIPAIATGFCNGVARTWGTCGALNGAIMAVNLAYGRRRPGEPVAENYAAVRRLIEQFGRSCGATQCSELLGCDLDTAEGKRVYRDNRLQTQCREYVASASRIAAAIVQEKPALPDENAA